MDTWSSESLRLRFAKKDDHDQDAFEKGSLHMWSWSSEHSFSDHLEFLIDLLMGLFRGAVFHHGGGALKQPINEPTETPTSTLALTGRFPLVNGPFSDLNGAFHRFRPKGPFYLLKIHWKTAH